MLVAMRWPLGVALMLTLGGFDPGSTRPPSAAEEAAFEAARTRMVRDQIAARGIKDDRVLGAMARVPRHEFVPAAQRSLAYEDGPLPIGHGQTISQPYIVAFMTEQLDPRPTDRVLEIGTGSGFMAALLAHRARQVLSLEINPELAAMARSNLQQAGISNVQVRQADGAAGAAADGPFDVILLSGSVAEVPHALLEQLRVGGRLAAIVGDEPIMFANIVTRVSASEFKTRTPWDANAPRLQNFAEHSQFSF